MFETTKTTINTKTVEKIIVKKTLAAGLEKYLWLMDNLHNVNVALNRDYQKKFKGYYRIRQRSTAFYQNYFAYLEAKKESGTSFEETLMYLHSTLGTFQASFSSKLVATINPDKPVWDQHVMRNMGIKAPNTYAKDRMAKIINTYNELERRYQDFLDTEKAKQWLAMFDAKFPHANITNLKKIDLILWQLREESFNNVITTLPSTQSEYWAFAEEILEDLSRQGFSGEKLLSEFKKANRQVRPAVEALIAETDGYAEAAMDNYVDCTESIFRDE